MREVFLKRTQRIRKGHGHKMSTHPVPEPNATEEQMSASIKQIEVEYMFGLIPSPTRNSEIPTMPIQSTVLGSRRSTLRENVGRADSRANRATDRCC